jgi:hypothetical protein
MISLEEYGYPYIIVDNVTRNMSDIYFMPNSYIHTSFHTFIVENHHVDSVLDKLKTVGGFDKLNEMDKLILLGESEDETKLKKIDLIQIYKDNSGTFGNFNIKVKVKPIQEQKVKQKFSEEFAGKTGYLMPYLHSSENGAYATVRFDEFITDENHVGSGHYPQVAIMIRNMYPIGYSDTPAEFTKYDRTVAKMREDFKRRRGLDDF